MTVKVKVTNRINLGKLPMVTPAQWTKIGQTIIDRIRRDTSQGISQDYQQRKFTAYSKSYREFKEKGYPIKGRRTFSQIRPPDLKHTGDMMEDIYVSGSTKGGVTISFGEGKKVLYNRDAPQNKGRRKIFDINSKNRKWITNEIVKIFHRNGKKK